MINRQSNNHMRQQINDENLLQYKDIVANIIFERNLLIVEEYMSGISMAELGRKYNVSSPRIRAIIYDYIRYCHRYMRRIKHQ